MSASEIASLRQRLDGGGGQGVWAENAAIVAAFLAVSSQWRTAAIGGGLAPGRLCYLGLDYAAALAGLAAAGVTVTPELWAGVRLMEAEAARALNE